MSAQHTGNSVFEKEHSNLSQMVCDDLQNSVKLCHDVTMHLQTGAKHTACVSVAKLSEVVLCLDLQSLGMVCHAASSYH